MAAVRWTATQRDALSAWSAKTGRPIVHLTREALDQIIARPGSALRASAAHSAATDVAVAYPISRSDHDRWKEAGYAIDDLYGTAVSLGVVVRGLVVRRLITDRVLRPDGRLVESAPIRGGC